MLFLILCAASFLYTFPVYNKYWAPFDEGIIVIAAERLLSGELPYKDFFIVMYPPGQIYVLATLFKIFSTSLITGRIYTVFISIGISMLVFCMTRLLTKNIIISIFSWFIVLISLVPRLGAIPVPIWPGIFLALFAIYIYMKYLKNTKSLYILFAGLLTGLAILFRHDIGFFAFVSIFVSLILKLLKDKKSIRDIGMFIISSAIIVLISAIYFVNKSATHDMVHSLFIFPLIHQKTAVLNFPQPCFDLNMIFHGSLHFIMINQYYIPILIYIFSTIYLLNMLFRKRLSKNEDLMVLSILLFGILTFNQVRIRTDPPHLLTVIQPSVILFGFLMHKNFSDKFSLQINILSRYVISALIAILFVFLSVKNIDKYIKNSFRKIYKKEIIGVPFNVGTIYIPKEEKDEILDTVNFIKDNTRPHEKIYVGNVVHWKDDFGGSLLLYFLCERLPSTKYYEILPGLITQEKVQEEIKESLSRKDVNLVVLQDIAIPVGEEGKSILDDYIEDNFKIVKKIGKYNIYVKK